MIKFVVLDMTTFRRREQDPLIRTEIVVETEMGEVRQRYVLDDLMLSEYSDDQEEGRTFADLAREFLGHIQRIVEVDTGRDVAPMSKAPTVRQDLDDLMLRVQRLENKHLQLDGPKHHFNHRL